MDLISALASNLGVAPEQAKAVAGTVLGGVQAKLGESSPEAAQKLTSAVPELGGWQAAAQRLVGAAPAAQPEPEPAGLGGALGALGGLFGGGQAEKPAAPAAPAGGLGGLGGLLGAAATALGGEEARQTAAVVGVLAKLNIDPAKAALVAPTVLSFLKSRLDASTLDMVLKAAPVLAGMFGGAAAPATPEEKPEEGLGGMLSGFLKR